MIPDAAVEALLDAISQNVGELSSRDTARLALEVAAPHMLAASWSAGYLAGEVDGALQQNGHEPPSMRSPYEYNDWASVDEYESDARG